MPSLNLYTQVTLLLAVIIASTVEAFTSNFGFVHQQEKYLPLSSRSLLCSSKNDDNDVEGKTATTLKTDSFQTSDSTSKGLVSFLTNAVNSFAPSTTETKEISNDAIDSILTEDGQSSSLTPQELMDKLREDYEDKNYLWTGDLYTDAFVTDCQFTDPTISFVGIDTYKTNVNNLVPIMNFLTKK